MEQLKIISAFTTPYDYLSRRLINEIILINGEKKLKARALWDTGATGTCISKDVVKQLGLKPTGFTQIGTPSGESTFCTYLIDIILPNNVAFRDKQVCDSKIGEQGIDVLIGMDIIWTGNFAISNYDGKTVFTFAVPSTKRIDFVHELQLQKIVGKKHGHGIRKKKKRA